jgi:ATP-dependent protease ClpP protease subunit
MVNTDSREVFIYDEIGPSWMGMDSAEDMVRALAMLGAGPVSVRINSPGGDVFAGYAMYNSLRKHNGKVTTYNDGLAASAASVVLLAGEERVGSALSQVMIHEASTIAFGNADDFLKVADLLKNINGQLADLYATVSGASKDDVLAMMADETWLPMDSAMAMKFYTKKDDDESYQGVNRQIVPKGMYKHAPEAFLKPEQMLKLVKNRPDAEKEKRYEKLFNLTGVDLRVK